MFRETNSKKNHFGFRSSPKPSSAHGLGQSGQIIVEYVLLLVFAVTIAIIVTKSMISRDPGNPGFIIGAWQEAITQIGSDKADDIQR